ncbi:hypothetical protein Ahy_B03g067101 [Arachis hypogaea]|uniref:Uncharacterized protein n=1 Tax=Arachis hypogaea TaxID=3818 RepID=A0A445A5Q4_ARAHY|nr:hypothetical protein Ahy_B03g067101 [Arachis hypogaea]
MNFGVAPTVSECRGSFIKLTWLRNVKHGIILSTHEAMERYTRCHIMSLFGTTLFADKSGAGCIENFYPSSMIFLESGYIVGDQLVLPTCIGLCVGPRNMIAKIWMGL